MTSDAVRTRDPRRLGRAETALEGGDAANALGLTEAALRDKPGDGAAAALRTRALIRLGRASEAAEDLSPLVIARPGDAALRGALGAALFACGRGEDGAVQDAAALKADPTMPGAVLRTAERAIAAGAPGAALTALAPALVRRPDDPALLAAQATALRAVGDDAASIAALRRAIRARPADARMRARLAVAEAEAGQAAEALDTLAPLIADDAPPRAVLSHLARASLALGRPVCGPGAFRDWLDAAPAHPPALEALLIMLRLGGRHEDASAVLGAHLGARRRAPLAALLADPPPSTPNETALSLGWARADQSRWRRGAWRARALRGAAAGAVLRDHVLRMEFEPDAAAELSALCDPPDWTPLRNALAAGRGCVLASIHHGPSHALAPMLRDAGLSVHMVSGAGAGGAPGRATHLAGAPARALRGLARRLEQGGIIGMAPDWQDAAPVQELACLDGAVGVSPLAPRLAFLADAPSFQLVALWRGGRVTAALRPLPTRRDGETRERFVARWSRDYADLLAAHLRAAPENISFGPMWAQLAAAAHRIRRGQG